MSSQTPNASTNLPKGEESDMELISREELLSLRSEIQRQREHITALEANFTSFMKFKELPKELRIVIWEYTCIPRIIMLDWTPGMEFQEEQEYRLKLDFCANSSSYPTSSQIPTSAACKESRQVFERRYERVDNWHTVDKDAKGQPISNYRRRRRNERIYINFDIDTILLPESCFPHRHFTMTMDTKIFEPKNGTCGLRFLAIWWTQFEVLLKDMETPSTTNPIPWLKQVLDKFPLLEELIVLGGCEGLRLDGVNLKGPYECTDLKLVAFEDDERSHHWEQIMGDLLSWPNLVKEHWPAFASVKVHVAAVEETSGPGDYKTKYIKMGPAEESDRIEQRWNEMIERRGETEYWESDVEFYRPRGNSTSSDASSL